LAQSHERRGTCERGNEDDLIVRKRKRESSIGVKEKKEGKKRGPPSTS